MCVCVPITTLLSEKNYYLLTFSSKHARLSVDDPALNKTNNSKDSIIVTNIISLTYFEILLPLEFN